ncbi:hypothetical protein AB0K40_23365 [Nonomuraea bangladeshensis]|uniref:Uncharacterized protein n=1 Tax=Nonomuraea bangladeshensis TaxID=404385 RepID=A0ABV3H7G3_9ACTN
MTVTHTATPKADDVPLTDHLQGWGTVAAALIALAIALVGWKVEKRRREADRKAGGDEREQDRKDADRRLHDERAAADRRLQQQRDEQWEQDRRAFLIAQLQALGDLYASMISWNSAWQNASSALNLQFAARDPERLGRLHQLRTRLAAIPSPYASLMKVATFGTSSVLVNEASLSEARQRVPVKEDDLPTAGDGVGWIRTEEIYRELADNIGELLGQSSVVNASCRAVSERPL